VLPLPQNGSSTTSAGRVNDSITGLRTAPAFGWGEPVAGVRPVQHNGEQIDHDVSIDTKWPATKETYDVFLRSPAERPRYLAERNTKALVRFFLRGGIPAVLSTICWRGGGFYGCAAGLSHPARAVTWTTEAVLAFAPLG
jgi:hypothetical protein